MNPWDEFAARIDEPEGTNIYPAMAEQIISPAIVIVAADPWMEDSGFQYDAEHYLAICLAEAAAPQDALERIHQMVHAVREAGGEGWDIGDVSGVRQASIPGNDGIKYLGSWVQLTFRSCEHTVEEGS